MTKDYKLGNAIPELTVPVTDKSGRMTRQWREYFERDRVQQGGQGGDANYETLIIQTDDQSVILELKEQIGEAVAQQRSDFEAVLEQTQTLAEELRQQRDDALAQASVLAEEVKGLLARLDELSVIREASATEDSLAQVSQRVDDLAIGLEAAQSDQEPSGALEGRLQSLEQQLQEQAVAIQSIQGASLDADFLNADIINAATSVGSPQGNFTNATIGTLTLTNPLAVAQGGTGATTATGAATNLGLGTTDTPDFAGLTTNGVTPASYEHSAFSDDSTAARFVGMANLNAAAGAGAGFSGRTTSKFIGVYATEGVGSYVQCSDTSLTYDCYGTGGHHAFRVTGAFTTVFDLGASRADFSVPVQLPSYAVASLPSGAAGDLAYATNGRKAGEGGGSGTGVQVFHDGSNWIAVDTGATVAA